jgi:WD40 repeat protein
VFRKRNLVILAVLSVICLSTLCIGGLYIERYVDCSLNQNVDTSASRYTQIESNNLESIQSENVHRLTELASARGTNQGVRSSPVFSPDDRYLAVGGVSGASTGSWFNPEACGNIWVWNLKSGHVSVLRIARGQGKLTIVTFLEFSPDSNILLSNEYQPTDRRYAARLWNLNDNFVEQVDQSFRSNRASADSRMQFSADGRLIAYQDESERLRIYSVDEAKVVDIFGGQDFLVT